MHKSHKLLAVVAGFGAFMIAEMALSVALMVARETAEAFGENVDVVYPWAAILLFIVCVRVGITVKRRVAKWLQERSDAGPAHGG
jgi:uncharacterized membrane protein YhhN